MSLHFAAAKRADFRTQPHGLSLDAANDNAPGSSDAELFKATLRHFAEHGLSAARRARENAERARFAGCPDQYRHWMAICSALDRRMAMTADCGAFPAAV